MEDMIFFGFPGSFSDRLREALQDDQSSVGTGL